MSRPNKILVVQPLPGVGDMIWHVPHLRAIRLIEGNDAEIVLLAKVRSRADSLLAAYKSIDRVSWLDKPGSPDLSRGHVITTARVLRLMAFDKIYVLHHSPRYLCASWLAGIAMRASYGFGFQWLFINNGIGIATNLRHRHPIYKATAFIESMGQRVSEQDGLLQPMPTMLDDIEHRLAVMPKPWLGLGIGSSEIYKQYGADRLSALACSLAEKGWRSFILLGGPNEKPIADHIQQSLAKYDGVQALSVADWPLTEVIAAQAKCAAYIGNDTGFLNISAALGVKSYGLFGATEPLFHSSHIHPIVPVEGYCPKDGMNKIDPAEAAAILGGIAA